MKQIISIFILVFGFAIAAFAQTEQTPCPKIEVTGGGVVRAGEPMTFTANVTGLSDTSRLKYEWEMSNGTISSGPGTATITVDTTGLSNTEITAKVKVLGLPESCADTALAVGSIPITCGYIPPFDEFGRLSNNDAAARIQNLFIELDNYPEARGFIFNYGTENEIGAREKQLQSAIKRLKLDLARVTMINAGKNPRQEGVLTTVYVLPPGVDTSTFVDILTNKDKN